MYSHKYKSKTVSLWRTFLPANSVQMLTGKLRLLNLNVESVRFVWAACKRTTCEMSITDILSWYSVPSTGANWENNKTQAEWLQGLCRYKTLTHFFSPSDAICNPLLVKRLLEIVQILYFAAAACGMRGISSRRKSQQEGTWSQRLGYSPDSDRQEPAKSKKSLNRYPHKVQIHEDNTATPFVLCCTSSWLCVFFFLLMPTFKLPKRSHKLFYFFCWSDLPSLYSKSARMGDALIAHKSASCWKHC